MKVVGNVVILTRGEVLQTPPPDLSWSISMLKSYGLADNFKGILGRVSRCVEVLKGAGYQVRVVENEDEVQEAVSKLKLEQK